MEGCAGSMSISHIKLLGNICSKVIRMYTFCFVTDEDLRG